MGKSTVLQRYQHLVHKKGIRSNPENYRPISITSAVRKIIESIIRDIIGAYMNDYNLHSDCQHGFCKHRSGVIQLLHVVEDLSDMLDNGDPYDIIYLDIKKTWIRFHIDDWLYNWNLMA